MPLHCYCSFLLRLIYSMSHLFLSRLCLMLCKIRTLCTRRMRNSSNLARMPNIGFTRPTPGTRIMPKKRNFLINSRQFKTNKCLIHKGKDVALGMNNVCPNMTWWRSTFVILLAERHPPSLNQIGGFAMCILKRLDHSLSAMHPMN
jgi:hypothetical protein